MLLLQVHIPLHFYSTCPSTYSASSAGPNPLPRLSHLCIYTCESVSAPMLTPHDPRGYSPQANGKCAGTEGIHVSGINSLSKLWWCQFDSTGPRPNIPTRCTTLTIATCIDSFSFQLHHPCQTYSPHHSRDISPHGFGNPLLKPLKLHVATLLAY